MKHLPFVSRPAEPPAPRLALEEYEAVACSIDADGCLTCGDVAVPVTVTLAGDRDVLAVDAHGNEGRVAVDLVGPVRVGDRLLVHAGAAIDRLEGEEAG